MGPQRNFSKTHIGATTFNSTNISMETMVPGWAQAIRPDGPVSLPGRCSCSLLPPPHKCSNTARLLWSSRWRSLLKALGLEAEALNSKTDLDKALLRSLHPINMRIPFTDRAHRDHEPADRVAVPLS